MKRQTPEDRFAYIVPVHREHDYQPDKKRKYHNIRNTANRIRIYTKAGYKVAVHYNIKEDRLLSEAVHDGITPYQADYTVHISTHTEAIGERDLRKYLDKIITEKGYDRIRFS